MVLWVTVLLRTAVGEAGACGVVSSVIVVKHGARNCSYLSDQLIEKSPEKMFSEPSQTCGGKPWQKNLASKVNAASTMVTLFNPSHVQLAVSELKDPLGLSYSRPVCRSYPITLKSPLCLSHSSFQYNPVPKRLLYCVIACNESFSML